MYYPVQLKFKKSGKYLSPNTVEQNSMFHKIGALGQHMSKKVHSPVL
jgi:hypothetical protein